MIFVFVWYTSLNIIVSGPINVAANGIISFFSLSNIPLCVYHISFSQLSVDGHFGCFYVLAIINSAVMNIGVAFSPMSFLLFI